MSIAPWSPEAFEFASVLTHREAMVELDRLTQAVGSGCRRIDMSRLEVFDSSVLAVMLAALRARSDQHPPVRFVGVPEKLRGLAQLYGLHDLLADALA